MVKAKRKKKVRKKHRQIAKRVPVENEPEYMVQISEPKMLRKDLLESLREIILFMQSYEKFKAVQDEKVAVFNQLKAHIKELNNLIDKKLKGLLPKGKLKAISMIEHEHELYEEKGEEITSKEGKEKKVEVKVVPIEKKRQKLPGELEELESQLKDIEDQLKGID